MSPKIIQFVEMQCVEQQSNISRFNGNIIDVEESKNSSGKTEKKGKNIFLIRDQN